MDAMNSPQGARKATEVNKENLFWVTSAALRAPCGEFSLRNYPCKWASKNHSDLSSLRETFVNRSAVSAS